MQVKMPPRRRGGRVKAKSKTLRDSRAREKDSSEDTDGNSAKEIVRRLAKKYLLKSSTDTCTTDSEQKENIRGHREVGDPYDGDLETDGGVTTTSDMECQTDESSLMDDDDDSDVLSPSRKTNKQTKTAPQRRKRGQQASSQRRTRQQKKVTTYEKQKNTSKRKSDADQASRGSQTDSECEPQSLKKSKLTSLQHSDSGFHVSPLTYGRPVPRLPKMNASDTSTPSSAIGPHRSLDDSCFGFDHIMSPQGLPFSPVESVSPPDGHRPGSAMSNSMSSFAGSSIMSPPKRKFENVVLTGLIPAETDQKEMPAAKKPKKKKNTVKVVKKNDDEWASKMSAEFDDIDMYELTIEG